MKSKLKEHHDENDFEEDNVVIKDFDDVFDYIGGWGPFQVKIKSETMSILMIYSQYQVH